MTIKTGPLVNTAITTPPPAIIPGGRMLLPYDRTKPTINQNVDYVARALQFDALSFGNRDEGLGWEDNILSAGIYNPSGKHRPSQGYAW